MSLIEAVRRQDAEGGDIRRGSWNGRRLWRNHDGYFWEYDERVHSLANLHTSDVLAEDWELQ